MFLLLRRPLDTATENSRKLRVAATEKKKLKPGNNSVN